MQFGVDLGQKSLYRSFGLAYHQNPTHRRTMEDEHVHMDAFAGSSEMAYFAVMDGHGGRGVVELVKNYLIQNCASEVKKFFEPLNSDMSTVFKKAFNATDQQVQREISAKDRSGCTAVVAVLKRKGKTRTLHVANIGDSRALVIKKGGLVERLSFDHKATDPGEKERIEKEGGLMIMGKVAGILGVTRAFGDFELKESPWLITDPHVNEVELKNGQDTHVILACDGLFDVTTDEQVAEIVAKLQDGQTISETLVKHALDSKTRDNISVMCIQL